MTWLAIYRSLHSTQGAASVESRADFQGLRAKPQSLGPAKQLRLEKDVWKKSQQTHQLRLVNIPLGWFNHQTSSATVDGSEVRRKNQLRLVVYPIIYQGFMTIPSGEPNFWTINSISRGND